MYLFRNLLCLRNVSSLKSAPVKKRELSLFRLNGVDEVCTQPAGDSRSNLYYLCASLRRKDNPMLVSGLQLFSLLTALFCSDGSLNSNPSASSEKVIIDNSNTNDNIKMTNPENYKEAKSIYDFTVNDIQGNPVSLEKYKGHVCIIVNVASECGLTKSNYAELVEIYDKYADSKGLRILAFPCNQFGGQEPGSNAEICHFMQSKNVRFDKFEKVNVNGNDAHPLWKYLKYKQGGTLGDFIKWNFTKFIIDKNGQPVERHGPNTDPKDLVKYLEKYW